MALLPALSAMARLAADTLPSPYRYFSGAAGLGAGQFSRGRVRNISEALPATGLIVPGTDSFKGAAGKITIRDGAPAGRTGVGQVDYGIAVAGVTVRLGAGLKEQDRQHE